MASAGRGAGVPAELGGESSLVSRPSWLPNKGSTPPAPRGRGQEKDGKLRKSCNCKNSRCLKLYCECFASGQYCFGCNCQACHNNPENDEMRKRAIEQAASLYLPVSPCISLYIPISPLRARARHRADARAQPLGVPTEDQPLGARRREHRFGRPAQQGLPL